MYNRYIPQPDGSYRRNRVPEPPRPRPTQPAPPPCPAPAGPPQQDACPKQPCPNCRRTPTRRELPKKDTTVTGFLKKLLPKDFDTGDLLIVLLLLLMSGDCAEDQNTALLTLMLYFFM
ncbi:MAG: hypothetical protein IJW45_01575 [Oscillospiraceae bacterium]|nr:hypothetical protein [Oscillospiraceae bacterium]